MARPRKPSAILNVRHNLSAETVEAFRAQADARGLTHGEWLSVLVAAAEGVPAGPRPDESDDGQTREEPGQ